MPHLTILLTRGFKKLHREVAEWVRHALWDSIFLDLPVEAKPYLDAYLEDDIGEDELWRSYKLLTGLTDPFINSLKLRFQPVLESLKQSFLKSRKVHCYTDLRSEVERKGFTERLLLLEFRYRATGRLDLKEWRRFLIDEAQALKEAGERAIPRIIDESEGSPRNLALYSGFLDGVDYIGQRNFDVEIVLLKEYWKSPLDTLRTMAWKHGVENIPDETIETYLKLHKKYTDLVLKLPEIDQAHEAWSRKVQMKRRLEEGRSASSLRRSGLVGMDDWRRPSNLEEDRP